jgi:hypothetical protein
VNVAGETGGREDYSLKLRNRASTKMPATKVFVLRLLSANRNRIVRGMRIPLARKNTRYRIPYSMMRKG